MILIENLMSGLMECFMSNQDAGAGADVSNELSRLRSMRARMQSERLEQGGRPDLLTRARRNRERSLFRLESFPQAGKVGDGTNVLPEAPALPKWRNDSAFPAGSEVDSLRN